LPDLLGTRGIDMPHEAMLDCRCPPQGELPTPMANSQPLPQALQADLLAAHGELIGGAELARLLGFKTPRAFQKAAIDGRLPIETFVLDGRRGRFARTRDLATWLDALGCPRPG